MNARIDARLRLRASAAEHGLAVEPTLIDFFATPDDVLYVLYGLTMDETFPVEHLTELAAPLALFTGGRHRVGGHSFEGDRHLFLECDVEGPIANPEWGATRVSAALVWRAS